MGILFLFLLQNFCVIFALMAKILLLLSLEGEETLNEGLSTRVGYVLYCPRKFVHTYHASIRMSSTLENLGSSVSIILCKFIVRYIS